DSPQETLSFFLWNWQRAKRPEGALGVLARPVVADDGAGPLLEGSVELLDHLNALRFTLAQRSGEERVGGELESSAQPSAVTLSVREAPAREDLWSNFGELDDSSFTEDFCSGLSALERSLPAKNLKEISVRILSYANRAKKKKNPQKKPSAHTTAILIIL
ncbi:hypothetical protein SRHO_G00128790, partial [Serrasalmus rhombeus]